MSDTTPEQPKPVDAEGSEPVDSPAVDALVAAGNAPASEPAPEGLDDGLGGLTASQDAERKLMAFAPRIHVQSTWGQLRENPLFRRNVAFKRAGQLFDHPIATPIILGVAIAACVGPAEDALGSWLVSSGRSSLGYLLLGVYLVAFLAYFGAMGYQRLRCQEKMREMRDNGSLDELLTSGLSFDDAILGLVFPYEIGDRLGVVAIMGFFLYESQDSFWRIVIGLIILNNLWNLYREGPIVIALQLEQYFAARRLGSVWKIMLMAGVPLLAWFALLAAFYLSLPYLISKGFNPKEGVIIVFVATMIAHGALSRRWAIWRLKRFIARYGGLGNLIEEFFRAKA